MTVDDMKRGVQRLKKRLKMVEEFDPATLDRRDPYSTVRPLETDIEGALVDTFGSDTVEYGRFAEAARFSWPMSIGGDTVHERKVQFVTEDRSKSMQLLQAAIALLQERIAEAGDAPAAQPPGISVPSRSKRIFIVHGHDNEPKEAVARFLSSLGYEPVILHEQANKGRTIIQKFREEASDVGFAIVLMSADDQMADGKLRARQNVILELGFFLGKLGPDRVAAIVKGQVERPSDFDGVVYISFNEGWKVAVAKELQAAGYEIDWNAVMK
jgi:predicted nucleotide-binding protein